MGVDLAVGLTKRHDETALTTVFAHDSGQRALVNVEGFRAELPQILERIESHVRRYHVDVICIEAVAAQAWAAQFLERLPARILQYRTNAGALSLDRQAEALGVELAHGLWQLPSDHEGRVTDPEVRRLRADMLRYSPSEHCPDRLAALLFARWAISEAPGAVEFGNLNLGPA
jgi:hypothetical protein